MGGGGLGFGVGNYSRQMRDQSYVKRPLLTGSKIFLFFSFRVCYFLLTIIRLQKTALKIDGTLKKVFNIKRVYKLSKDYLLIPFLLLL